jgi:hypothetical protein
MNYPLEDFLGDYDAWRDSPIPISTSLPPEQFFGLLSAFFGLRYEEKIAETRCMAFRKAMASIWNSQQELIELGLMGAHSTGAAIIPRNLLCAAHELIIVKKLEWEVWGQI